MSFSKSLIGSQAPRLFSPVEGDTTRGDQAVKFARWLGMTLFPWQEDLLRDMCRTAPDGRWRYRESVVVVPRQNGKGEVLIARELAGIYLFGEKEILHTAHFLDTAVDARDRLWSFIAENDDLLYWWEGEHDVIPKVVHSNGKESIEFPNGATVKFRTRTDKTGRGLSIDLLVFDECYNLPDEVYSAISKTTRARPNPHKIFISSPVNRAVHYHGKVFSAHRWAGIDGANGILFREWSADPEEVDPFSREALMISNPSLVESGDVGAQIADLQDDQEAAKKSAVLYASYLVESLGFGDWVPRDKDVNADFIPIIDPVEWAQAAVDTPDFEDSAIAVSATPSASAASMVMALQGDGFVYLTLAPGTDFVRDELSRSIVRNVLMHDPVVAVVDDIGPCSALIPMLQKSEIDPVVPTGGKVAQAYELFLTMWAEGRIKHDGDPRWLEALSVMQERAKRGRYRSIDPFTGDVTCFIAATLAVWGLMQYTAATVDVEALQKKKRYVGHATTRKYRQSALSMSF
ncbi:hypothetical protein KFR76_09235 [Corynebacterium diphtheriae]|nr:hypothetical protein KFR76_09235 [Corynebacterium diphtheriae]